MERRKLAVIDYGLSNIGSLVNMLKRIGANFIVTGNHSEVLEADKIILPGIGAFDEGMKRLADLGLIEPLNKKTIIEKTPTLGICLGMQLMAHSSEEGKKEGLSWFDGEVVRFRFDDERSLKIPHMSWNFIVQKKESILFADLPQPAKFYFVHSYHLRTTAEADILCTTRYGYDFVSAVERGNIAGVQFHPEKSHKFGMQLLRNFVDRF